jgi:Fe-S-cluster containining protein
LTILKEILPDFYSDLLNKNLLNLDVTETKATCNNCLRSRDHRFPYTYKPHLKCCTFYPFLPNYAVGGILKKKLKGAEVIQQKIKNKEFTLPLGAFPTLKYQHQFYNKKQTDFGNREDLLCPYYNKTDQNCNVWEFRGVVCSTYYCRSDRGNAGQNFWTSMSDYLSYVELALAEECLVQLDFSPRDISDQLHFLNRKEWTKAQSIQDVLSATDFKFFWNGYIDYEKFYLKCYDLVQNVSKKEFAEILGDQGLALAKKLAPKI